MDEVGENMLKSSRVYYSDGTFDSAPQKFLQVYVVFGQVEGSKSAVPGMYALLGDRTAATYKELFQCLYDRCGGADHHMIDFEAGALKAITQVAPNTTVSGFVFHLKQSWHRQLQTKGLVSTVQNDEILFRYYKYMGLIS